MKKIIFGLTILCFLFVALSYAEDYYDEAKNFKIYNPDGQKYDFIKHYLMSLSYLKRNEEKYKEISEGEFNTFSDKEKTKAMIDQLIYENANIRIAKNILKRYQISENGLILLVTDLFVESCETLTSLNSEEKELMQTLYEVQLEEKIKEFDIKAFMDRRENIAGRRKDSLKQILEASMLARKVLISDTTDEYGELIALGVTERERKQLKSKLDEFKGQNFKGEIREGQSFMEASISVVRSIIEDDSWMSLDE